MRIDPYLLTEDEHEAMRLSGLLANLLRRIVGDGPQADHDWNELAQRIHAVQHTILAQAAARAYPHLYRPLGGVVPLEEGLAQARQMLTDVANEERAEPSCDFCADTGTWYQCDDPWCENCTHGVPCPCRVRD